MLNSAAAPAADLEAARRRLLQDYRTAPGVYDEMVTAGGALRPHWRGFVDGFLAMSDADRRLALETAQRLLRENGLTYVVEDEAESGNRPWQLDLFPLLITQAEWDTLEAGLIQRATLLNEILKDLYGGQRLLKEGVLPPALVYGNPQFLRPCHGIDVPGGTHLHFVAVDLARAADGRWWVLSDRAQAPSGAGFALENRIIATHCLPELFAEARAHRVASFFQAFSEHFQHMARRDEPLAVVLTAGPGREIYFEHAYLARYLGYSMVEGSDLTARDDRLYLKTIEGLKPVDLVLRRIDSDMCDPLELRTDSFLGVPGLLQVARERQVVMANAIGSGLVENEALLSFLPAMARFFLGGELAIPSIATWWCGQARERDHVIANLRDLVIRKMTPKNILTIGQDSAVGAELGEAQAAALAGAIARRGFEYIGQQPIPLSTVPVWTDGEGLRPAPMTLRVYLAATENGYRVMPGGLARVSLNGHGNVPWLTPGDLSKDTWLLSDGPADTFSLLAQPIHELRLRRGGRDLPSRAADNLFWLGRYAERTEGAVRLFRSLVSQLSGEAGASRDPMALDRLVSLLVVQQHLSQRRARRAVDQGGRAVEAELWTILFDQESPDGLANVLGHVRRIAELVRERLSLDTWQILKELTELGQRWRLRPGNEFADAQQLLNRLIQHLAAFNGMVLENMTRGYGWRFLDLGRRIERVRHTSRLVRDMTARGETEGSGQLELLLDLADSTMTYRGRYKAGARLPAVLDLLLADPTNPRSLLFQLEALDEHIRLLPLEDRTAVLSPAQRIVTDLTATFRLADMIQMSEASQRSGARFGLDRMLRKAETGVDELSSVITRTYFSHSMVQRVSGPQRVGSLP